MKKLTIEQKAAHNAEVLHNMRFAGFKRTIADIIKKNGCGMRNCNWNI